MLSFSSGVTTFGQQEARHPVTPSSVVVAALRSLSPVAFAPVFAFASGASARRPLSAGAGSLGCSFAWGVAPPPAPEVDFDSRT
jgi:hypothetical protein